MSDIGRVITTIAIWLALMGILMGTLVLGNLTSETVVWITLILSLAGAVSTGAIWKSAESDHRAEASHSKQKRSNRTTRFVEKMDEDQLVELEELLAARREDRLIDR